MTKKCDNSCRADLIRRAGKGDLGQIMRIISDTVQVMNAEGNDQWDGEYPKAEHFERDIANGTLFVLEEDGALSGFICLDGNGSPGYDLIHWAAAGKALVIHRLAVSPETRGRSAGKHLMDFAEQNAAESGAVHVLTDTYSLNKKAIDLFEKRGYVRRGELFFRGKLQPFYVYEKLL